MEESTTLQKLSRKVGEMLKHYDELRLENERLKETIKQLESENESSEIVVARIQEELLEKDREIEEIVNKIESILG